MNSKHDPAIVEVDFTPITNEVEELSKKCSEMIMVSTTNLSKEKIKCLGASAIASMAFKAAGYMSEEDFLSFLMNFFQTTFHYIRKFKIEDKVELIMKIYTMAQISIFTEKEMALLMGNIGLSKLTEH